MPSGNIIPEIDLNRLPQYAKNVAGSLNCTGETHISVCKSALKRALEHIDELAGACSELSGSESKLPAEVEWLLDNRYIAMRDGKQAMLEMRGGGYLRSSGHGKKPAVLEAATALVRSGKYGLSEARMDCFLDSFQDVLPLTERELSLFAPMLVMALVEQLELIARDILRMLKNRRDENIKTPFGAERVNEKLRSSGESVPASVTAQLAAAKARHEELTQSVANIITSLRMLSVLDISSLIERRSVIEQTLNRDPSGVYPKMTKDSRAMYRTELARMARRQERDEAELAREIVTKAQQAQAPYDHVGYLILPHREKGGTAYYTALILLSLLLTAVFAIAAGSVWVFVLLLLPVAEAAKRVLDHFILKFVHPRRLPRIEFDGGLPEAGKTLCAIATLMGDDTYKLASALERIHLSNRTCGDALCYALMADLKESPNAEESRDSVQIERAKQAIDALNEKYGARFFLLIRARTYNARTKKYMPWERKRGATLELMRYLRGRDSSMEIAAGTDDGALRGVQYLLLLDSDTEPGVDTIKELVSAALHPMNRPVIDGRGVVREGYGILQPKVITDLAAANKSWFSKVFAGQGGFEPYATLCSDLYYDLSSEGTYTGKGLISVDAYLDCLDNRLPNDRILSHDLLEGAYLRAGFAGDVEFSDGFPSMPNAYFKRMHRWTRGDWQLLPWFGSRVRNAAGERVENPINGLNKWKIFDNLRRSLTAPMQVIALVVGALSGNAALAAVAVATALLLLTDCFSLVADKLMRPGDTFRRVYRSNVAFGVRSTFQHILFTLLLLPTTAAVNLSAIFTSLYRQLVSKKNMLAWITAAEAEKRAGKLSFSELVPPLFLGLACLFLSPYVLGKVLGILWIAAPAATYLMGRPVVRTKSLSADEHALLLHSAQEIWQYFAQFLTAERNYLPPDNYQVEPQEVVAERTSPTNIGLALLSALAAVDMKLCPVHTAVGMVENMLASVERMEKWEGHLYNWYDTKTLKPMQPKSVSTVDSGNLVGCLLTLSAGLRELGEHALAARADSLGEAMRFEPLYNRKRRLFHISYNADNGTLTDGYYDLMESEARQTSYIAVARGDVPKKHWQSLGRPLARVDGYCGMASWTGSMFEYLMPNLIMPSFEHSIFDESLRLCLRAQKQAGKPWGISESSFFAFDPAMNYSYKAHGVQEIALKRGMQEEHVVSPYSTFLTVPYDTKAAVQNLKRLKQAGMEGRFGFYEALDLTERRTGGTPRPVKCFMAHHLGMSLLSIDNALCDGVMQRRFMAEPRMAAYAKLLQEKGPVGSVITKVLPSEIPEKSTTRSAGSFKLALPGFDLQNPTCSLLSNSSYTLMVSDTGKNASAFDGTAVTRFGPGVWEDDGILFFLRVGEETTALQPAPDYSSAVAYNAEFSGERTRQYAKSGRFESCIECTVPPAESGERRTVSICNPSGQPLEAELVCYFVPVLARSKDFEAHPAFSKLSIQSLQRGGSVVFERRGGGNSEPMALCFAASKELRFDTSREQVFGRGGLRALNTALKREAGGTLGAVIDPCLLARVSLSIPAGETEKVSFALALAKDSVSCVASAARILRHNDFAMSRLDNKARVLEMPNYEITIALRELSALVFDSDDAPQWRHAVQNNCQGKDGLWRFGVSGDLPVLTASVSSEDDVNAAIRLIKRHALLERCGFDYDLVLALGDGAVYHRPLRTGLMDFIRGQGMEGALNARGGIHLLDATGAELDAVLAMSQLVVDLGRELHSVRAPKNRGLDLLPSATEAGDELVDYQYDAEGNVVMQTKGGLNRLAWSNILTNGSFGYIAELAGTGNMWYKNARESKLNNWKNDPLSDVGTELVQLERQGKRISLFAARDGIPCRVTFGFGFAQWEKMYDGTSSKLTAYVHPVTDARVLLLELNNAKADDKVIYFTELICSAEKGEKTLLKTANDEGNIEVFKEIKGVKEKRLTIASNVKIKNFTTRMGALFTGETDGYTGVSKSPCVYAEYPAEKCVVLISSCDTDEATAALCTEHAAQNGLAYTKRYWKRLVGSFKMKSPDPELDRYMNGWVLYQVLASRLLGRTALYQSGGAYGFRDQLQDVCALILTAPELTEQYIKMACRHQYVEGDVQHWWHPDSSGRDRGVRTRYSDDLLWLPYVVALYCKRTGKLEFVHEQIDFLRSGELHANEHDRYEQPESAGAPASIYEHCLRSVRRALDRGRGTHGLLLIGGGDWNDGFSRVGQEGRGESVWLTWFAAMVMDGLAELAGKLDDPENASWLKQTAAELGTAADAAWDGAWYLRAFYDSGRELGGSANAECAIDSIAQSFAAFSAFGQAERVKTALRSAYEKLYDAENRTVALFAPAFDGGGEDPGYIRAYLPGVRENGGQYTHAAIWLAGACLQVGMVEEGWTLLKAILPLGRDMAKYEIEPYVLSGDVYTTPGHQGRGGWSWYTGAAAWYYRIVVEELLGIQFINGEPCFRPKLPQSWAGFEASLFSSGKLYSFVAKREPDGGVKSAYHAEANQDTANASDIEQTVNSSV